MRPDKPKPQFQTLTANAERQVPLPVITGCAGPRLAAGWVKLVLDRLAPPGRMDHLVKQNEQSLLMDLNLSAVGPVARKSSVLNNRFTII